MKILVVSDIHYSLRQYDWLVREGSNHDLVIIAGDLLEMASPVDLDTQASVVTQYFQRISATTPLVVCSGNHDLLTDCNGICSSEWLEDLAVPNLTVDLQSYRCPSLRILSFPWWSQEEEKAKIESWLDNDSKQSDQRPVIWVHHAPPLKTKVSWNGRRDAGDATIRKWIASYSPALVLSGHVHNAPYYAPEGSWIDRVGDTVVVNGGRQIGEQPATVSITMKEGRITWCGMEGCEEREFSAVGLTPFVLPPA